MRGKGEGSIFKESSSGLWTGVIELPPLNGERRRKKIRRKSKAELLRAMSQVRSELIRLGDLPTSSQTVEQWFNYWLKQVAKEIRPNTFDGYRRTVENHVIPSIGKVKLDKLTATHIRRVHDGILDKGLSSTTALLAHRTMSVSFKMAVREGRIGRNPAELTAAPKKARATLEALALPEALEFLRFALDDTPHYKPEGAQWATALLTGARRGEVLGLERDRVTDVLDLSWQLLRLPLSGVDGKPDVPVDYEYRHLTGGLYLTRPKSSKSWRIIPLLDPLKSILAKHLEETRDNQWGLMFTKSGRPISPDQASRDWRASLAASGIDKDVRLHDVRHTTVDLLYAAGIPEDIIMSIVGHSTRTTTRGYQSMQNRERLTGAMIQFSALFTQPETGQRREIA